MKIFTIKNSLLIFFIVGVLTGNVVAETNVGDKTKGKGGLINEKTNGNIKKEEAPKGKEGSSNSDEHLKKTMNTVPETKSYSINPCSIDSTLPECKGI